MPKITKDYLKCDSCGKEVIEEQAIDSRWIVATGESSISYIKKSGELEMKKLGYYCSKGCFYEIVKEETTKEPVMALVENSEVFSVSVETPVF